MPVVAHRSGGAFWTGEARTSELASARRVPTGHRPVSCCAAAPLRRLRGVHGEQKVDDGEVSLHRRGDERRAVLWLLRARVDVCARGEERVYAAVVAVRARAHERRLARAGARLDVAARRQQLPQRADVARAGGLRQLLVVQLLARLQDLDRCASGACRGR
jgi:hypothetical protein